MEAILDGRQPEAVGLPALMKGFPVEWHEQKADLSRLRRGHRAQNMALVRRLAFNIIRAGRGKRSIKTARKAAGWDADFLTDPDLLNAPAR